MWNTLSENSFRKKLVRQSIDVLKPGATTSKTQNTYKLYDAAHFFGENCVFSSPQRLPGSCRQLRFELPWKLKPRVFDKCTQNSAFSRVFWLLWALAASRGTVHNPRVVAACDILGAPAAANSDVFLRVTPSATHGATKTSCFCG